MSVIGQVKADSLGLKQSIKPQKKAGRESFIFKYIVVITITKKNCNGNNNIFLTDTMNLSEHGKKDIKYKIVLSDDIHGSLELEGPDANAPMLNPVVDLHFIHLRAVFLRLPSRRSFPFFSLRY